MFKMTKKKVKNNKTIDLFNNMTDKQLDMFSYKLSRLESFQNHFRANVGEDLKDYAIRVKEKLKDRTCKLFCVSSIFINDLFC